MAIFKLIDAAVLVPIAITAAILNVRYSLGTRLVEGLVQYAPTSKTGKEDKATLSMAGKSTKKNGGKTTNQGVGLGDAENFARFRVPRSQVINTYFYNVLDNLVFTTQLAVCTCLAYLGAAQVLQYRDPTTLQAFLPAPIIVTIFACMIPFNCMARVDLLSKFSSSTDKGTVLLLGLLGLLSTCSFFAFEYNRPNTPFSAFSAIIPRGTFGWDVDNAGKAIGSVVFEVIKAVAESGHADVLQQLSSSMTPHPVAMRVMLCFIGSIISGLLIGPVMRFVRSYKLQQEPPQWSGDCIVPSAAAMFKMNVVMCLPVANTLVWTNSLFKDILGLDESTVTYVRAGLSVCTGLLFLSTTRLVLQRYLDTAVITWHTLKHGSRRSSTDKWSAAQLIHLNTAAIRQLLNKAAVQSIAPGCFYLAAGMALITACIHPALQVSQTAKDVQEILNCVVGFSLWWTGLVWTFYAAAVLVLLRSGGLN